MITTKYGQSSHHKMLQRERIGITDQKVNQFVTIKYRYALTSLLFLSISIVLMLSVSGTQETFFKLAFAVLGFISIALSVIILSKSSKITKNNDIHNTDG